MAVIGYIRVSTDQQKTENQELSILKYANDQGWKVDDWIKVKMSSRKSTATRRIDELLETVEAGDVVIVAELSRLARSVGQIANIVDAMIKAGVRIICIKEAIDLNGKRDIQSKVMVTMFSLFAEIERDLISERTKEGLHRARTQGRLIGRPKGRGKSKLDGREEEIRGYLNRGVNVSNIAKLCGVSRTAADHFIKTRIQAA